MDRRSFSWSRIGLGAGMTVLTVVLLVGVIVPGAIRLAHLLSPTGDPQTTSGTGASSGSPPSTSPAVSPTPAVPPPAGEYTATRVAALLGQVRVLASRPQEPGYDRDCGPGDGCVFGTEWTDDTDAPDSHNGCDTRDDVLREQLVEVAFKPGSPDCDVVGGSLVDPYTGTLLEYATQGSQIHVDHLFPLAAAWDLGAATWSPARRTRFANDTSVELLAVLGSANEAKGDSTPASWLPPSKPYRCEYVVRYLEVAAAYDLALTTADVEVIGFVQRRSCPA